MKQEGYWKWLMRTLKETFSKKNVKQFIIFPIWEIVIGCFVIAFAIIWIVIPVVGWLLVIGQAVLGILISLHGVYRESKLW